MQVRHAGEPFSLIPLASEPQTYGAANVPLPAERLDLAPHTPPAAFAQDNAVPGPAAVAAAVSSGELAASSDAVERTRAAIGVRVERMLATLAFRAAAAGQSELRLSDRERFTPQVSQELLSRLPINLHAATPILDGLLAELRQLAQGSGLSADWGRLVERPEGLFLELKPFQHDTEPFARSRVFAYGIQVVFWLAILLMVGLIPSQQRSLAITIWSIVYGVGFLLIVYCFDWKKKSCQEERPTQEL